MADKSMGFLLLVTAALVVSGFAVNEDVYWIAIDAAVIFVCSVVGVFLLMKQPNTAGKNTREGSNRES